MNVLEAFGIEPPKANRKLYECQVKAIRERHSYGVPAWWLAKCYVVHRRTIEKVLARETWDWT